MEKNIKQEQNKVEYLIDMIKDMDITNKLRLAICMCDSNHTHLGYDKIEMYKYFDELLKEIDIIYKTTIINFAEYPYIMFAMAKVVEMNPNEQNQVALYLFNSIEHDIRKRYKCIYKILDIYKQMF